MDCHWSTLGGRLRSRSGMTLMEVMLALAIFLVGSVSIVGLFAAASLLHADAVNRRTTSFIARELLAEVNSRPMREVFAKTTLVMDMVAIIRVDAVTAGIDHQAANFDRWPLPESQTIARRQGPLLIEGGPGPPPANSEWAWYNDWDSAGPLGPRFLSCERGLWGTLWAFHNNPGVRILSPRTWYYAVDDQVAATPAVADPLLWDTTTTVYVKGDPTADPPPPSSYIVIDEEWIRFESTVADQFQALQRGQGDTKAVAHRAGTPVTVAREHPRYPGFYYTVQFYPVNATGAESQVIVSVAYGKEERFRAHFFRSIYTPSEF